MKQSLYPDSLQKNWTWLLVWGILLVILGVVALSLSALATMVSIVTLGIVLLISGLLFTFNTFKFWWGMWGGFISHLTVSILYLAMGILLIKHPVLGAISLTLMLAIFFIILGVFRVIVALSFRIAHWGWNLLNGLVTLILGILIMYHWPASGLFIIGIFIGIELLFSGWVCIALALGSRS